MKSSFLYKVSGRLGLVCLILLGVFHGAPAGPKRRPPTSAEKEFHIQMLCSLRTALPEGPAGWRVDEETPLKPLKRVLVGQEKVPFAVSFTRSWRDPLSRRKKDQDKEREEKLIEQSRAQADRAENMATIDALTAQLKEANDRGDREQSQTLHNQINRLLVEENPDRLQAEAARQEMKEGLDAKSGYLRVTLEINRFAYALANGAEHALKVQPELVFYRTEPGFDPDGLWQEGSSLVFLGKGWQFHDGSPAIMHAVMPVGVLHTAAYGMVISVQGEEKRVRQFLEEINWKLLTRLLNR